MITENTADSSNKETETTGAVLYTDGSCKYTNPGFIGWAAHGYTYKINADVKPSIVENHLITNEGYFPLGAKHHQSTVQAVEVTNYLDFFGSSLLMATNNEAELQAFTHALERIATMSLNVVNFYTDSQYVRNGIVDWCKNWERYDWKKQDGTSIINYEWWMRAYALYKKLIASGMIVNVNWVKGHNDIFGNTHADILAGIGTNYSMDHVLRHEFKISPAKGYWKNEIEKHPFLNFKRVYFNSVDQYNIAGHYFQADTGGADLLIGKRIPETGLAVIKLKEAEPAIEEVKKRQYDIAKESNAIIMMKLDRVFSKEVYPYLIEHGKYSLLPSKGNLNISFFDKKPVTVEVNPTGLSMRAIESFNLLEELLDGFLQSRANGFDQANSPISLNAHDITAHFYNTEEKQVKKEVVSQLILKPEYIVGFRDTSIEIEEPYNNSPVKLKIPLILGTDLIPRNSLKKLETHKPTVYLLTWRESPNSIRYATVIECDSGIGIWSNFFADKIFFPKTT